MCRTRVAGFSLVELMVAIGIVGILVTLAWPRYHAFMVQSRRGEAKSNLSHIVSLQAAYKIDHFKYYYGDPMTGMNGIGYRDGRGRTGQHPCAPDEELDQGLCNHLGFQPESVRTLRYLYRLADGGMRVVAGAASDADQRWIYPDCRGIGTVECGANSGDVVAMNVNGRPEVCRNITKHCPPSSGGGGGAPLPPIFTPPSTPTITCDTAVQCCPDGPTGAAVTTCTRGGGWSFDASKTPSSDGCCACNTSCPGANEYRGSDCVCHPTPPPPPPPPGTPTTTCDTATQCCPDGPTGAAVTTCTKGGGWSFDASAADCCKCSLSCKKGEWLSEECECRACATCSGYQVHTTKGSCVCACDKTEQEACEDRELSWGASCDCSSLNPNYAWSKFGDCYYICSCNVAVAQETCKRMTGGTYTLNLTDCECEQTIDDPCDPSAECCTGTRPTIASDCASGKALRPFPNCCTNVSGLNILTVRAACILTTVHSLRPTDKGGDSGIKYDGLREACGSSLATLSSIDTVSDIAAECAMNSVGIVPSIESMYTCIKNNTHRTNQSMSAVRSLANTLMGDIHNTGCNITGNTAQIAREPNQCTLNIPPR